MKERTTAGLAWSLWGVTVALAAANVALALLGRRIRTSPGFGFPGFLAILAVVFGTVGAVVASRQPRNAIGWIFSGVGIVAAVQGAGLAYAVNGIVGPQAPWPAAEVGAWLNAWVWFPAIMAGTIFVFLLFPDGRFLSRRWRIAGWVGGVVVAATTALLAVFPGPLENFTGTTNPFAVHHAAVRPLGEAGFTASNLVILASVAGLIVRYRQSVGRTREQIKWIAYAGGVAGLVLPFGDLVLGVGSEVEGSVGAQRLADVLIILVVAFIPISTGIAILRYRLYDIDRIISRSVAYAIVVGLLASAYVGLVVLFQAASRPLTGGSDLAVAASTLLVAAAFVPLLKRVRDVVDRRFNRHRYDAQRTIDVFSARLREETDIDRLTDELREVVRQTMQPRLVSLWLRAR